MNKKIIVMYAGYIDWSSYKVFDSMYGVLKHFQNEFDMPDLTLDEINKSDCQKKSEIKIVEADYYSSVDDGLINDKLSKCRAVRKAVNDKYFSLEESLKLYGVTIEEYRNYIDTYDTN